ncbi:C-reactive protein-like [Scyliorhinus canicula]|uniref:C-reactive protein-like n=1 Tax=Scyliorhinus canicula TaxID=7830 RepID=UPI0018F50E93|nr:C-reactive protein-like [Scyliorhinus canicula]
MLTYATTSNILIFPPVLRGKSLVFPSATESSYVTLQPVAFDHLSAFTLCMRIASEQRRSYSLFSYATSGSDNELLLWRNEDATFSVYLSGKIFPFVLPDITALMRHLCVSWVSTSGRIAIWLDGVRSLRHVGHQGGQLRGGGTMILGQEQDKVGGKFDVKQCFVGEVTDVNMWDRVLSPTEIRAISQGGCHQAGGNIIDWATVGHEAAGTVSFRDNEDCTI